MRPQKLTPEQMLNTCALQFKAHGYAGTSMEMLAKACGLSKASFYYYYPNKQALLMQILAHTHLYLNQSLFKLEDFAVVDANQQFQIIHDKAVHFFSYEIKGCLVGILSLEASHISLEVLEKIREIFQDWQNALYQLFQQKMDQADAKILAKISVADYEGAILMYRLNNDLFYLNQVKARISQQLAL
ncbi:TetR/AcrR family transcriptional regulator [Acinetobacter sp. I-MWF]|uniref:TetR/AcrR family transcriptional regulator n=1 Tax=Acinetobacter sp. I-MWF TaxID=2940517 RepID=UPI0021C88BC2|nr:TetR/AcrR family transcriptional regulator [Acinetobacter sp. I-MWF]MCT9977600.1 TetR/AcrR family transcriptional regulator [Acinetobacter sp. I-MWF]